MSFEKIVAAFSDLFPLHATLRLYPADLREFFPRTFGAVRVSLVQVLPATRRLTGKIGTTGSIGYILKRGVTKALRPLRFAAYYCNPSQPNWIPKICLAKIWTNRRSFDFHSTIDHVMSTKCCASTTSSASSPVVHCQTKYDGIFLEWEQKRRAAGLQLGESAHESHEPSTEQTGTTDNQNYCTVYRE
ncbi:hypothetical protein BBP40_005930 [Aspergillus hancockii]|nr:hypothetical protein BBP40_005930 [Aspergillus hancockii]